MTRFTSLSKRLVRGRFSGTCGISRWKTVPLSPHSHKGDPMQGVPSNQPPGAVCMVSGDLTRYALSMQSLMGLRLPLGSTNSWHTGVLIAKSINMSFQYVMDNPQLQWAWIMGDDHQFDADIVLNLLAREKDVIVPLCLNRLPPMDPTVIDNRYPRMKY